MASDKELLKRIALHDADAFETLMKRHRGRVEKHLTEIVRDKSAADDLCQEVFLRMWEDAGRWDVKGSFSGWLRRVCINHALNHLRSVKRRKQVPLVPERAGEDESDSLPAWMTDVTSLGPDEIAAAAEERQILGGMVDELPAEKRQILRMISEEEMSMAEVAGKLGIPLGTVKSRLHYSMQQLGKKWDRMNKEKESDR